MTEQRLYDCCPGCHSAALLKQMWVRSSTGQPCGETQCYAWCERCEAAGGLAEVPWNQIVSLPWNETHEGLAGQPEPERNPNHEQ